jgi:hypothetical protein
MALRTARDALSRFFYQRCFWLFVTLLALIVLIPFMPPTTHGRFATNLVNACVLVATVAAVGRTLLSFVIVLLLAVPTLVFQWLGFLQGGEQWLLYSWMFGAALYLATTIYLVRYVFRPEVMTADKLFGAAAGYLMLGILWAYFYTLVDHFYPPSFSVAGKPATLDYYQAIYFSVTALTTTGFGDIAAITKQAQAICIVEQVVGSMFVAILIARLAGVYPPQKRGSAAQ